MKSIFKILVTVIFFLLFNTITAQTFKSLGISNNISGFNTQTSQENFLLNQGNVAKENVTTESNAVYVAQIGSNNTIRSATKSNESDVVIIQKGNQNTVHLDLSATKLKETVLQNGNNNTFLDYGLVKSELRNAAVNQTGGNQNLTILGSNSLSEKMKISMQGEDQSIIIRNF